MCLDKTYLSVGEFADRIGVTVNTLRNWDKNGKLKPHHKTAGGLRVYTDEQADEYLSGGMFSRSVESS